MAQLEIDGKTFEVDGDGFLVNPKEWNEEVARLFAKTDGTGELSLHPTTLQPYYMADVLAKTRPISNGFALYHSLNVRYANQVWVNREPVEL